MTRDRTQAEAGIFQWCYNPGVNPHSYTYVVCDDHIVDGVDYCNGQDRARLVLMNIMYKIIKIHPFYSLLLMNAEGIMFWDAKSPRLHCTRYSYSVEGAPASGFWKDQNSRCQPLSVSGLGPGPLLE